MTPEEMAAKIKELEQEKSDLQTINQALRGNQAPAAPAPVWHEGLGDTVDEHTLDVARRLEAAIHAKYDAHIQALETKIAKLEGTVANTTKVADGAAKESLQHRHRRAVEELYKAIPDFAEVKNLKEFQDWAATTDMTSRIPWNDLVIAALHDGDGDRATALVRQWPGWKAREEARNPPPKDTGPSEDDQLFAEYQRLIGQEGEEQAPAPAAPEAKAPPPKPPLRVVDAPPPAQQQQVQQQDTRAAAADLDVRQPTDRGASETAASEREPAGPGGSPWTPQAIADFNDRVWRREFERTPELREMKRKLMRSLAQHEANRMRTAAAG